MTRQVTAGRQLFPVEVCGRIDFAIDQTLQLRHCQLCLHRNSKWVTKNICNYKARYSFPTSRNSWTRVRTHVETPQSFCNGCSLATGTLCERRWSGNGGSQGKKTASMLEEGLSGLQLYSACEEIVQTKIVFYVPCEARDYWEFERQQLIKWISLLIFLSWKNTSKRFLPTFKPRAFNFRRKS